MTATTTAFQKRKLLMLSWEYPPVMVGGLGRHVHALATTLARAGHDVTVATRHAPGAPLDEVVDGVRVVRAPEDPPVIPLDTEHLLAWAVAFNQLGDGLSFHAQGGRCGRSFRSEGRRSLSLAGKRRSQ